MYSQVVSLAWDGHHKTLVNVFEKLLEDSHIEDCTIVAEGQKLKAHKQVLSAFSPYFELLFSEETESNPTVILSGISFRDLRSLVNFMYQGKLEVTKDRIRGLIDAAECLQIKGLGGGNKDNGSENTNNTIVLCKRPVFSSGIPNRTRKVVNKVAAVVFSNENNVNNVNFSNEIPHLNSVLATCVPNQNSSVHNVMLTSVQNVPSVSNVSVMPMQSTLSGIEMDNLPLNDEPVDKKESDPDGDENTNAPMRNASSKSHVCGSSEISTENTGEETISGLSAYTSVPTENNIYEDLPSDCDPPAVLSSQLCSRDSSRFSVKNELCNGNMNLPSPPRSAQNDNHLQTESENFSENTAQGIGVPSVSDVQMNDFSGAEPGCISESASCPQEHPGASVKIRRIRRCKSAVKPMPGLHAAVNPHDSPTLPSHTTPVCDRDMSGPIGRDVSNRSNSTNMQYPCQMCSKTFARNRHLNVHMRIHAEEKLLRNEKCNKAAATSIKLKKHQRTLRGRRLYSCSTCKFKTVDRTAFRVHLRVHSGVKPYKCTECEYTSAYSNGLKLHQRTHSGAKPYKCTECDYTSAYSSCLKIHQRIHNGLKPYKCTECDYTSAYSDCLKLHERKHSGTKPFKCAECRYTTASKSDLNRHKRIHSGVKPYKCEKCDYSAYQMCYLKRHERVHTGARPYSCAKCDFTASSKSGVSRHQRIHSGVKPYKCTECEYASGYSDHLKRHMVIHHSKPKS